MQVYLSISQFSKLMFFSFNWFLETSQLFGTDWIAGKKIPVSNPMSRCFFPTVIFNTFRADVNNSYFLLLLALAFAKLYLATLYFQHRLHNQLGVYTQSCLKIDFSVYISSIPAFVGSIRHPRKASTFEHSLKKFHAMEKSVGSSEKEIRTVFRNTVMLKE